MPHIVCGAKHPDTGQRCTKRPGHYPKTQHSSERPGYEVAWWEPEHEKTVA